MDLSQGRFELGIRDIGDVAQAQVSLANFRSTLLTAENAALEREAALRNILGLPPMDDDRVVPVTPPSSQRAEFQWKTLLTLAEEQRPDLIELKLVLEADQQQLLQVRNETYPQLDAVGAVPLEWARRRNAQRRPFAFAARRVHRLDLGRELLRAPGLAARPSRAAKSGVA